MTGRLDNSRDSSNDHLDDSNIDSGDHGSLYSLFSSLKQDGDSTDTSMSLESALDKRTPEDEPTISEKGFQTSVKDGGLSPKKRQGSDDTHSDPPLKRRTKWLALSVITSSDTSDRESCATLQPKNALTSSQRLQCRGQPSSRVSMDSPSSSCEVSSFSPNLGSKNVSPVTPREANVQQDVRSSEDDHALHEKIYEYNELVGYKEVSGKPVVAVSWTRQISWEPASSFPPSEVATVKKKWKRQRGVKANLVGEEGHHRA